MENLSQAYLDRAEFWTLLTTAIYFLMNGAQLFETLIFVPRWAASPPESLQFLQDGQGLGLKAFWIGFHSLHELTFILAILFCWKIDSVRNGLILIFILHFAVRAWTLAYFAPNIIDFQKIADTQELDRLVKERIENWKKWNFVRVAIYIGLSAGMVPLLLKLFHWRS